MMIGSILYAMLVIYVIVCIVLWGLLLYAASGNKSYGGYAIMAMIFVPFWPAGVPFALYGLARAGSSLIGNAISNVQQLVAPVAPVAPVQSVVDAAKTKEAADAATREKTVAVVTDAKAAATALVVDTTAVVIAK